MVEPEYLFAKQRAEAAKRQAEIASATQCFVSSMWFLFGTRTERWTNRVYWPFGQYVAAAIALVIYLLFW